MSEKFSVTKIDDSDGLVSYMKDKCERIPPADIWISPPRVALPSFFLRDMERIHNMEVRPDDTWVITFPKCGTTWTQEMVWLLGNQCNFELAKSVPQMVRFPFVELHSIGVPKAEGQPSTLEMAENMKSPRFLKSHLPYELLPHQLWTVKPKIVYTCRNPLSTALSYFHHYRLFNSYQGDIDHFLEAFMKDQVDYGPYWRHVLQFWKMREEPYIYYNFYEDMKDDLAGVIRKVAEFLNVEINESQEKALVQHLSFSSMKDNPSVNLEMVIKDIYQKDPLQHAFIRKGEKDEWKTAITEEYKMRLQKWNDNCKKGSDFNKY